jgi:aerobic carbon-monoxide dehydrogenase medium subunit
VPTFELLEPDSVEEATDLLAQHGEEARIIAGGTAVVIMLKNRLISPGFVVSLGKLDDLRYVHAETDGTLRIGALTTIRELERSSVVRDRCPTLARACGQVGNVRVRNAATIGGNLSEADYASDPPAVLSAARARVKARGPKGEREIPLTEFFTGFYETALAPDEVLVEVIVPPPLPTTRSSYVRYVTRSSEDRPCVGVSAFVDVDDGGICRDLRVVVGAVSETPREVVAAEQLGIGQELTDRLIETVAEEYARSIDPLSDLRGSAWYRKQMVRVFVRDAIQTALADGEA